MPSAVTRISPLELGPTVGWPMQYRVSGPDLAQVRSIGLQLAQAMGKDINFCQVNFDWMEPARKLRIEINQDQARLLGLSSQALAEVLNTVMTGAPVTQVRDGIYLVNVITRAQDKQRVSLSTLKALHLPLVNGRTVPLSQAASRREGPSRKARNHKPRFSPTRHGFFSRCFSLLMAQFNSFSRLALVLSIAPMGFIGIAAALLLSGRPLGFVAILGILALMGGLLVATVLTVIVVPALYVAWFRIKAPA
ncbi:MAG TPA: efflux RND transporter permease subunit [Methylocella sp.]|nr:efflux RND transporter permease subunit [Methylocella sp.]